MSMTSTVAFLVTATVALAYAAILARLVPRCRGLHIQAARGLAAIIMLCPLLISAEHVRARAFAAVLCVDLMFKLLDLVRQQTHGRLKSIRFATLVGFLMPFPPLLVVLEKYKYVAVRIGIHDIVVAILSGVIVWLSFLVLFSCNRLEALRNYFWLDHAIKLAIFVALMEAMAQLVYRIERLVGFDTQPVVRQAFIFMHACQHTLATLTQKSRHANFSISQHPAIGLIVLAVIATTGLHRLS